MLSVFEAVTSYLPGLVTVTSSLPPPCVCAKTCNGLFRLRSLNHVHDRSGCAHLHSPCKRHPVHISATAPRPYPAYSAPSFEVLYNSTPDNSSTHHHAISSNPTFSYSHNTTSIQPHKQTPNFIQHEVPHRRPHLRDHPLHHRPRQRHPPRHRFLIRQRKSTFTFAPTPSFPALPQGQG